MSAAEKQLAEEVDRLKKWREGRDFTSLSAFNAIKTECSRCRQDKPHAFILTVSQPIAWSEPDISATPPRHEVVCRDCLTDSEIAVLLLPALHFVTTVLLRDCKDVSVSDNDFTRSLHYVHSYLSARSDILMRSERDQKEFSLRALEGLKNVPIPEININRLYSDLEKALARNIYLAAHPDDVPQSVEDVRSLDSRVRTFFRSGSSIEMYALRDSVRKCVEIFQRYFMRRTL